LQENTCVIFNLIFVENMNIKNIHVFGQDHGKIGILEVLMFWPGSSRVGESHVPYVEDMYEYGSANSMVVGQSKWRP
jgi:hypothetical protein